MLYTVIAHLYIIIKSIIGNIIIMSNSFEPSFLARLNCQQVRPNQEYIQLLSCDRLELFLPTPITYVKIRKDAEDGKSTRANEQ